MLDVRAALTVTVSRVVDDANNQRTSVGAIRAVVFLEDPQPVLTDRGKRWIQTGVLRCPAGSDIRDGDEITLPEGVFGVVGPARMNRPHCLGGESFGWLRYTIRKGG